MRKLLSLSSKTVHDRNASSQFVGFSEATMWSLRKVINLRTAVVVFVGVMLVSVVAPISAFAKPFAPDHNKDVTTFESKEALSRLSYAQGDSVQSPVAGDSDSAAVLITANTTVDIPKSPKRGVTFGAEKSPKLEVGLPNANSADEGKQVTPGVVAYPSRNGAANVVQALKNDLGVRFLNVIDNPSSPTEYSYDIKVPGGGSIELQPDGGAVILNKVGSLVGTVDRPWAKDASGQSVDTHFITNGRTLTQVVEHNAPGVVYPVVSDPSIKYNWWGVSYRFSRWETQVMAWGTGAVGAYLGWTGVLGLVAYAAGPFAQYAISHNYCLAVNVPWGSVQLWFWYYRC